MGGAGSTRRATVPNEQTIYLTKEAHNRISSRFNSPKEHPAAPTASSSTITEEPEPSFGGGHGPQPALWTLGPNGQQQIMTITAYEAIKSKEKELQENDKEWKLKLQELEDKYKESLYIQHAEFEDKMKRVEELTPKRKKPQCTQTSDLLAKCYADNRTQSLKCAGVFKDYANCVKNSVTVN